MRKSEELGGGGGESGTMPKSQDDGPPGIMTGSDGGNGQSNNIRRYLVLLQDCLAIKFVSVSHLQQKRFQKFIQQQQQQNNNNNQFHQSQQCCGGGSTSGSVSVNKCQCHHHNGDGNKSVGTNSKSEYEVIGGGGSHCHSRCSSGLGESEKGGGGGGSTLGGNDSGRGSICRGGGTMMSSKLGCFPEFAPAITNDSSSMMSKVDHSMQALFLYKEFREINLQCFWNSAVYEAFSNLEYKGSLLPSTIIVGSPIRKYLTILKTAWSRKMLRSPTGYLIDFLGEIEELIADPIAKSHFVPLSDSLCWAIHELTSSGEEAFVDDIFLRLASASPGMALPTKELIYQTLEKLTRERKIYQTAQGYFVVTPDTHRYISSTEPMLMMRSASQQQMLNNVNLFQRNHQSPIFIRPTSPSPPNPDEVRLRQDDDGREKKEEGDPESRDAPSPDPDTYSLPYGTFRRYNSLRIKKKDGSGTSSGCLPRRTLSMRLPKSKKKAKAAAASTSAAAMMISSGSGGDDQTATKLRADVMMNTGSFQNLDPSVNEQLQSRRRKHKSFLSRLLSFRGVRKSNRKSERAGRNATASSKPTTTAPLKGVISNKNGDADDDSGGGGDDGGVPKVESTNLTTISTQTNFSIENLNEDLSLLQLVTQEQHPHKHHHHHPPSKSSTLEREQDSDSGRCTDSHSDADAEITAALNRGRFTPTMIPDHHHLHHHHNNVYEKIGNDLGGLKVDVEEELGGRSPRSPGSSSQMSVSPSPSTFTRMGTASLGNGRHNHNHLHQPHSRCHSSASSSGYSYRDFYNLYRRRHYPNYYHHQQCSTSTPTPIPTSPTSLESTAELNEVGGGGSGSTTKPIKPIMRYPPRSFERKQIFDEVTGRSSFREKNKARNQYNKSVSIGESPSISPMTTTTSSSSSTSKTTSGPGNSSTTILTQTSKNTTNMELEFRLPLGDIFNAAMRRAGGGGCDLNSTASTANPPPTPSPSTEHHKVRWEEQQPSFTSSSRLNDPNKSGESVLGGGGDEAAAATSRTPTLSEINTMVNDLFTIKSFVKSTPFSGDGELSSTIEFRTRGSNLKSPSTPNNQHSSSDINDNNHNNNNHNHIHKDRPQPQQQQRQRYVIEAVSSKPYSREGNRESEII